MRAFHLVGLSGGVLRTTRFRTTGLFSGKKWTFLWRKVDFSFRGPSSGGFVSVCNAAVKREQWKACFPIVEREQGRCDSSKVTHFASWSADNLEQREQSRIVGAARAMAKARFQTLPSRDGDGRKPIAFGLCRVVTDWDRQVTCLRPFATTKVRNSADTNGTILFSYDHGLHGFHGLFFA